MMKKQVLCLITLFVLLLFCISAGCINSLESDDNTLPIKTIERQKSIVDAVEFWVDSETNVMYIYTYADGGSDGGATFEVLLNADGTPKLYNPESNLKVCKF